MYEAIHNDAVVQWWIYILIWSAKLSDEDPLSRKFQPNMSSGGTLQTSPVGSGAEPQCKLKIRGRQN